tara:strand:+ start:2642 stop:4363 length:1722 start_codon:yes stop_codon:yes gene_type:complete
LETLKKVWSISSSKLKISYIIFGFVSIINSIIEIIAISSILPLLDLLINKNGVFLSKLNNILDNIIDVDPTNIINFLYILIFIFILKFFFNFFTIYFYQKIIFDLRIFLSKKKLKEYLSQDYKFFVNTHSSILLRNISQEIPRIILGVIAMLLLLFSEIILILFIVALLLFVDFQSAIFIFASLIIIGFIYMLISKNYISKLAKIRINYDGKNIKNLKEIFENIKLLIIYNKKDFFFEKYYKNIKISSMSHMKFNIAAQTPRLFYEFILVIILLLLCIFFSQNLENIIYVIAIFGAAAIRLIPSISKFLSALQNIRFDIPALDEIIKNENEVNNFNGLKELNNNFDFNNQIELKNIYFSHTTNGLNIFEKLNIKIEKNSFIGIHGPSGIGKSTLFDLISGIVYPNQGEIVIDNNIKLDKSHLRCWQKKIGYIPQESMILDDTFLNNVAFGERDELIDINKFHKSIEQANLSKFIKNLKHKELTVLGERGFQISGGERQRIALARTLYSNSEILLLDEITSSLDKINEAEILKTISEIKNTTKILITHNKEVLNFCDSIFEVKDKNLIGKNKFN